MFVERSGPLVDAGCCSTVPYAQSPQFPSQHNDGFQPGTRVGSMPKITEGVAVRVVIWNALPHTAAGGKALARQWRTPRFGAFAGTSPSTPIVGDLFCVQNSRFHPIRERHPVSQTEGVL